MEERLSYDVHDMKNVAAEAVKILQEIRQELRISMNGQTMEWQRHIRELERISRGYENLLNDLYAAANVYGTAEAAAVETIAEKI